MNLKLISLVIFCFISSCTRESEAINFNNCFDGQHEIELNEIGKHFNFGFFTDLPKENSISILKDGNLIIANNNYSQLSVIKTDITGNIIWEIVDQEMYASVSIIEDINSDLWILANDIDQNNIKLLKLNSTGQIIGEFVLDKENELSGVKLINLSDGNILVLSTMKSKEENYFVHLMKIDLLGQMIWEKKLENNEPERVFNGIELTNGKLMVISGWRNNENSFYSNGFNAKIFDKKGEIINKKTFFENTYIFTKSMIETSKNEILICGNAGNIVLLLLDENLNQIESNSISCENDILLSESLCENNNSTFTLFGMSNKRKTGSFQPFILKTDKLLNKISLTTYSPSYSQCYSNRVFNLPESNDNLIIGGIRQQQSNNWSKNQSLFINRINSVGIPD